jgi:hypothetical protein
MDNVKTCAECKFHIHIQKRAHLQHCTKFPDSKGQPLPCAAVRPFDCNSGAAWEASPSHTGKTQ